MGPVAIAIPIGAGLAEIFTATVVAAGVAIATDVIVNVNKNDGKKRDGNVRIEIAMAVSTV